MRVLVTGGCGFVGSAVVRLAVERGDQVLNVDRRRRSNPVPALSPIATRQGYARLEADVADRAMMRAVLREFAPDAVIHLTACPDADPDGLVDAEIGAAYSIMEATRHYLEPLDTERRARVRLIHLEQAEPDQSEALTPAQAARAAAAALMDRWSRARDVPLVTCIAGEAFGPWQSQASFLARLMASLLHEKPFAIAEGGETMRDWLPIRDLASGILLAADCAPARSRIDLSVGAERCDMDMADSICALLDERAPRPAGPWMDFISCEGDGATAAGGPMLDPTEAERELGWRPQGFHAGLDRLLTWALASRAASQARNLAVAAE